MTNEYLGVFESATGDVCNDIVVSSWTMEKCIGEAIIKKQKEPLLMEQVSEGVVLLYRQNFFEEKIELFLWEYRSVTEVEAGMVINYSINGCVLRAFGWGEGVVKKEEAGVKSEGDAGRRTMEVLLCINQNNDKHPELLVVSVDSVFRRCVGFRNHKMILESEGSMLLQVAWQFPGELLLQYYSRQFKSCICVYNIERGKKYRLLANKHSNALVSDFYFSPRPQSLVEYVQNEDANQEELQFAEIKLDQNIKDIDIYHHTLLPAKACVWHYLTKLSLVDLYGDRDSQQLLSLLFPAPQPFKLKHQPVKSEL